VDIFVLWLILVYNKMHVRKDMYMASERLVKALNKIVADDVEDMDLDDDINEEEYEKEYEKQMEEVVELLKEKFGNSIVEYDVKSDSRVELLDANNKVVHVITTDQLTKFWNMVE